MTEVPYSMFQASSTLLGVYHLALQLDLPGWDVDSGVEEPVSETLGGLRFPLGLMAGTL